MKILCFVKKIFKWAKVYIAIAVLFVFGAFLFIRFVDRKTSYADATNNVSMNSPIDAINSEFDELTKHELTLLEKSFGEFEKIFSKKNVEKELYDFSEWNKTCEPELVVVNKKNPVSSDFKPDLKLSRGKQVSALIAESLEKLIHDAYRDGIFLWVVSGFRSDEHQKYLFEKQVETVIKKFSEDNKEISREEAEKIAEKSVQKPLHSEHITGLAVDFNNVSDDFKNSKEYFWLHENAHKYGFIERYQSNWQSTTGVIEEPWHLRYVGQKNAEEIKNSQMCLEEFIMQRLNFRKKH